MWRQKPPIKIYHDVIPRRKVVLAILLFYWSRNKQLFTDKSLHWDCVSNEMAFWVPVSLWWRLYMRWNKILSLPLKIFDHKCLINIHKTCSSRFSTKKLEIPSCIFHLYMFTYVKHCQNAVLFYFHPGPQSPWQNVQCFIHL